MGKWCRREAAWINPHIRRLGTGNSSCALLPKVGEIAASARSKPLGLVLLPARLCFSASRLDVRFHRRGQLLDLFVVSLLGVVSPTPAMCLICRDVIGSAGGYFLAISPHLNVLFFILTNNSFPCPEPANATAGLA